MQRLARALVPVENQSSVSVAARRRSTRPAAPSHVGRRCARLLCSGRKRSLSARPVAICRRAAARGLAAVCSR